MKANRKILVGGMLLASLVRGAAQPLATVQSQAVRVGETASFSVSVSGGVGPYSYQWQHNDADVAGETNDTLTLTNVQLVHAGRYSVIVTDAFEDVTISAIARLTVHTNFTRITILHDTWTDGDRLTGPVSPSNSVWYASVSPSLLVESNSMVGIVDPLDARLWLCYFSEEAAGPVDLAVGQMIKVSLVFTPTNVPEWGGSGIRYPLRFGLLNFADGATRLTADETFGPGTDGGVNVRGYMLQQSLHMNLSDDRPLIIRGRNRLDSAALLETAAFVMLGSGPQGYLNAPGFVSGTTYTLEFSVARTDTNSADLTAKISGGGLTLLLGITDTSSNPSHTFDCFAIRPNANAAQSFTFAEFKVEILNAPTLSPSFTRITMGSLVEDSDHHSGASWGDFDNDGFIDLLIANLTDRNTRLYRNGGDGTFSLVTTGAIVSDVGPSASAAWGDYDNDGLLDLFLPRGWEGEPRDNFLYRNLSGGAFEKIIEGSIVNDGGQSLAGAWADYDRDGFLDLFVANGFGGQVNFLYHNEGNGTFVRITAGNIVTDLGDFSGGSWGDYDNDGDRDLFAPSFPPFNDAFYQNNGDGTFSKITEGEMVNESGPGNGSAWGDYNNDGYLDLFVANASDQNNYLYRNNHDGTFTKIIDGDIVNDTGNSQGCSWGDYDNDGWLDLFVANAWVDRSHKHFIYHNNGDGTFTRIINDLPIAVGGNSIGGSWGDYDNDGFLDLIVPNGGQVPQQNFLYHNDGNSNCWLTLKLIGSASNRSAVGSKVRVKAVIKGATIWQLREVSAGSGLGPQNDELRPHFGLGNATNVDLVRIEWPSGTVQELHDVAANQILTITEPPRLQAVGRQPDGSFQLQITAGVGFHYVLETSSNLTIWTPWTTVTNTSTTMLLIDETTNDVTSRFYRVRLN